MHQPGYVQGGQEVGRGYLLLRIHVRRIRSLYNSVPSPIDCLKIPAQNVGCAVENINDVLQNNLVS
jgi:hypothetical protein